MKTPKYSRGSIWYFEDTTDTYEHGILAGSRPVLIISNDKFNKYSNIVNCLPITTSIKRSPVHIGIVLEKASQIQCEQIYTVNQSRLTKFIGNLDSNKMQEVERKLLFQFDIIQYSKTNNTTVDINLDVYKSYIR